MTDNKNRDCLRKAAKEAALRGLDFFVRHQIRNEDSADNGRFPFNYNSDTNQIVDLTSNWTTGTVSSALMCGWLFTGNKTYLEAAKGGISYIKSLQDFYPGNPRLSGVFHEINPQTPMAWPRDALTAAMALLDCSLLTGDEDGVRRAGLFGDWFVNIALETGYPYWTVRFDDQPWDPAWYGSFHSGSALFMYKLYSATGDEKYRTAMFQILDFYNANHIDEDGNITVILDRETLKPLEGKYDPKLAPMEWQIMHRYNDDFGALANLAAWKLTGEAAYRNSTLGFLDRMCASQLDNGGFGPEGHAGVPSAGGSVIIELLAAGQLGLSRPEYETAVEQAVPYLLNLQKTAETPADGAFFGTTATFEFDGINADARTAAYAIMGLLRFAGAVDEIYFFK